MSHSHCGQRTGARSLARSLAISSLFFSNRLSHFSAPNPPPPKKSPLNLFALMAAGLSTCSSPVKSVLKPAFQRFLIRCFLSEVSWRRLPTAGSKLPFTMIQKASLSAGALNRRIETKASCVSGMAYTTLMKSLTS